MINNKLQTSKLEYVYLMNVFQYIPTQIRYNSEDECNILTKIRYGSNINKYISQCKYNITIFMKINKKCCDVVESTKVNPYFKIVIINDNLLSKLFQNVDTCYNLVLNKYVGQFKNYCKDLNWLYKLSEDIAPEFYINVISEGVYLEVKHKSWRCTNNSAIFLNNNEIIHYYNIFFMDVDDLDLYSGGPWDEFYYVGYEYTKDAVLNKNASKLKSSYLKQYCSHVCRGLTRFERFKYNEKFIDFTLESEDKHQCVRTYLDNVKRIKEYKFEPHKYDLKFTIPPFLWHRPTFNLIKNTIEKKNVPVYSWFYDEYYFNEDNLSTLKDGHWLKFSHQYNKTNIARGDSNEPKKCFSSQCLDVMVKIGSLPGMNILKVIIIIVGICVVFTSFTMGLIDHLELSVNPYKLQTIHNY
ncbi:hypothetical protein QTN25_004314 [Entamoeba marina]